PQSIREDICKAAVRLAQSAGYNNAGTAEFLVDQDNRFYFIEVNARIQVEHPVTELVTGADLIQQQIAIAAGAKLDLKQRTIPCNGSAIEVRINAEDPANNFRGCPGKITKFIPPGGPGVRFDSHAHEGYVIPPHYDSMIGKLIVHRPTRDEAIATLKRALDEFVIEGVKTTIPLQREILNHQVFMTGTGDTKFVEREWRFT
ncbi:MAG: acetyl-CoA carboxylase biotin carboxylase subunit, partial [Planctomycetaceae bacterium]|nr:acetyl-CoA carboxylase biotin carboxylase subunit [Planctomycetaceae bacterium]